jgi:hypothetical protein
MNMLVTYLLIGGWEDLGITVPIILTEGGEKETHKRYEKAENTQGKTTYKAHLIDK